MALPYEGLEEYNQAIQAKAGTLLDEFVGLLPEHSEIAQWALDQVKEYTLRPSKRIRGSLAASAYDQAKNGQLLEAGLQLGAAIEIVQNYLLIIDDVIDRSATRRGKPTIHRLYQEATKSDEREADMAGILIGSLPGQIVNYVISQIDEQPEAKLAVIRMLALDLTITDLAQIDDIRHQFGREISEEELLRKYEQKSSYYSFVNPLACGLTLAGCDEVAARQDAERFGLPAGIAFQLRDDYLGVFGDSNQTGKPNLDDMREGKYTYMVHLAMKRISDTQRETLEHILGNERAGQAELESLQAILSETGASDEAMARAERYVETARQAAEEASSWSSPFGKLLAGLVEFSVRRHA